MAAFFGDVLIYRWILIFAETARHAWHPGSTPNAVSSRLLCRDVNEINNLAARGKTSVVAS
jgi:hypothetical protein